MKRTTWAIFVFVFFLSAMGVGAQEKNENKFDKPSEVKNVKISKKKVLSESERKSFDEIERTLKGKPVKPAPTPDSTIGGATGILGSPIPSGGQRYAILVGLANYPGINNDLCVTAAKTGKNFPTLEDGLAYYCKDEDALNMRKALIDEYSYIDSNIFIFSDANAKFDAIKSKIYELLAKMTANDELVFFFSGHSSTGVAYDEAGLQINSDEPLDEAMFIYDQDYSEVDYVNGISYVPGKSSYIWDDQLRAWFADAPTKRIIFAFDTCSAGGMNDLEMDGRILAMSSTEYQSSWTYYLGGTQTDVNVFQESEGLFTHYFVKRAMTDELGDGFNPLNKRSVNPPKYDGKVAVEEAFNYAYPIVKASQQPVLNDKFFYDLLLGY
ncbi:MAG: Polysaccharide deacetylase [Candidatus Moranbacteria bacterium GW2011_GWF1_34_10]|nr:MAG: Polysaccharide deacetylase [Candidatus Moranbacteria bacterium GW2011_GWF1_34_10]